MQPERSTHSISIARLISSSVVLVALSLHFFVILLYAMPINPVSVRVRSPVSRYIEPIFYQNWQLFAPNPVNSERGILLRVRLRRDHESVETTNFIDITSPKIADLHATRFFPNLRYRIATSMFATIHQRDPILLRLQELDGNLAECSPHVENIDPTGQISGHECDVGSEAMFTPPIRELIRSFAHAELRHMAPEVLDAYSGQQGAPVVVEAQLRMVYSEPVPFSRRNEKSHTRHPTIVDSPWIQIPPP